ncbi:craniofacial development protein 2-like, partial [Diaphorina citri]|uniref:Craniofacial development protein 2-like n=1 Tax=Diaphorina citri TaxID=121845 RepID=A0A1S3DRS5_DIACI
MMESPAKFSSGVKIVPHSDLRGGTTRDCGLHSNTKDKTKPKKGKESRFATWNVRTLLQNSKLENLKEEMKKMNIDVLGFAEMRWPNDGDFWLGEYRVIHSGTIENKPGQGGVGVMLTKELGKRVKGYVHRKGRIILVKIDTKPVDTVIIQIYMPTTQHGDSAIEEMYDEIQKLLDETKGGDNIILMGDWNAAVGEGEEAPFVGPYGLGNRNERGNRLIEFCAKNKLIITNTWFKHHKRRRYTWKSPGDIIRTQIDYIIVKQRFRNQIKDCRSYASPDIDSDHNMVLAKGILKYKRLKTKKCNIWDVKLLKDDSRKQNFKTQTIGCEYLENESVQDNWDRIKKTIKTAADTTITRE